MIVKNYFGTAFDFLPKEVLTRGHTSHLEAYIDVQTQNNTIYLMNGVMPEMNELYEVLDTETFENTYNNNIINKIDGLDFIYHYDIAKKEKIIKKDWKDALDITYGMDGTITWFAVKLTEVDTKVYATVTPSDIHQDNEDAYHCDNINQDNTSYWHSRNDTIDGIHTLDYKFIEPTRLSDLTMRSDSNRGEVYTLTLSVDGIDWINAGVYNPTTTTTKFNIVGDIDSDILYNYAKFTITSNDNYTIMEYISFENNNDNILVFSDSVGVWEDIDRVVITETLSGTQGSPNIFKDFTLALRDTCNNEFEAEPTTEYTDNDAGVIIINAISNNVITNPERLQDLIIDGTTIGIENGQEAEVYLNGTKYVSNVFGSIWAVTVPAADVSALTFDTTYNVKVDCRDRAGNLGTSNKDVFVKAQNVAPVIDVVATVTLDEDTTTQIPLTVTDSDGSVTSIIVEADNGVVTFNSDTGLINYAPNENFNGAETIRVTATDDLNANTIVNIAVTVSSINDAPALTITENVTTDEDTLIVIPFVTSDLDGTIVSVTATATSGSPIVDTVANTVSYTPNLNFYGGDTIIVTTTDNEGAATIKNVTVTVNSVNDNPVIVIENTTTNEDTLVNVPYTVSDVEGGVVITAIGNNGSAVVDLENNQIIFTPDTNYVGFASFDVTVTDSEDAFITKTVNVEVTSVNDNPLLTINTSLTMEENTDKVISYVTADIDGTVDSVTASTTPNATITVDMVAQTITYTPNTEFIGEDSFTVTATDNEGGTDSKIITITVNNVDVAATITVEATVTLDEDTSLDIPFTITDFDGTVVATASALNGITTIVDGNITYTPNADFNGVDTITVTSTDELGGITTAEITATVGEVEDASIITVEANVTMTENTSLEIPYSASDVDGEITGATVVATNGTVVVADGIITYTPTADYEGSDVITLEVTDVNGGVTNTTINVEVTMYNTTATITVTSGVVMDENTSLDITFTVEDIDGDITSTEVTASNGVATTTTNTISYTPTTHYNGADTLVLTVTDEFGGITTENIVVTINSINEAAVVTIVSELITTVDMVENINYEVSDTDGDLTTAIVNATDGEVTLDIDNRIITYTAPSIAGTDTITLTVNDGTVDTVKTISVTINEA